ncbi:ROK family protein [Streptomyces sp. GXMU-J15]|uniref:ROK family protein n=1 Tax=Streptomyces fuscus TaxID=3048495 RepID=A0ABT7J5W8_9ACTN|nr:ROK family protein [Streptomyces fuscus]MDL2080257.1 ROK family protein [Streptomyces fuscus]
MPASPRTARAINDRLALRLLQQEGPLTAGRLKELTGLSRPSVADLLERLTAAGLIEVVGESGEQRRGPNAKVYGIVAGRAHLAALDVRTEGVSVAVSDLLGRVLTEASAPIDTGVGTGPAVEQAVALVERAVKEAGVDRPHTVGIGAPGLIDPATGELRDSTGLPEWHRRLVAALQERLPESRVSVENETNLAAVAEHRDGAARDRDTFVLLWLGVGVGAAVMLDGAIRRGASGGTGEVGFLPVPGTGGLPSATGCDGGFHSLACSAAVVELAAAHGLAAGAEVGTHGPAAATETGVPKAGAPDKGTPETAASETGALETTASEAAAPEVVASEAAATETGAPEAATPETGAPETAATEMGAPEAVAPEAGPPEAVAPEAAATETVTSEAVTPETGAPETAASEMGVPEAVTPETGAPETAATETGAPEAVAPEAAAPATAVRGTAVPEAAVRGTAVRGTAVPETAARGTAVPEAAALVRAASADPSVPAHAAFLDALADRVALGAAAVVSVLDPGCVVLAGENGRAGGTPLAERVQSRLAALSPLPTEVRPSALGGEAVLRGALLTAREKAQDDVFGYRD